MRPLNYLKKNETIKLPSINNGNNTSFILSNVLENRLREIKMVIRRATRTTRWTEISGSNNNGTMEIPFWVTTHLIS